MDNAEGNATKPPMARRCPHGSPAISIHCIALSFASWQVEKQEMIAMPEYYRDKRFRGIGRICDSYADSRTKKMESKPKEKAQQWNATLWACPNRRMEMRKFCRRCHNRLAKSFPHFRNAEKHICSNNRYSCLRCKLPFKSIDRKQPLCKCKMGKLNR